MPQPYSPAIHSERSRARVLPVHAVLLAADPVRRPWHCLVFTLGAICLGGQ